MSSLTICEFRNNLDSEKDVFKGLTLKYNIIVVKAAYIVTPEISAIFSKRKIRR